MQELLKCVCFRKFTEVAAFQQQLHAPASTYRLAKARRLATHALQQGGAFAGDEMQKLGVGMMRLWIE